MAFSIWHWGVASGSVLQVLRRAVFSWGVVVQIWDLAEPACLTPCSGSATKVCGHMAGTGVQPFTVMQLFNLATHQILLGPQ